MISKQNRSKTGKATKAESTDIKSAISYHGASVTMIWVVFSFMLFAVWLVIFVQTVRFQKIERALMVERIELSNLMSKIVQLEKSLQKPETIKADVLSVIAPQVKPIEEAKPSTSPSGVLKRGSLSPDGTKFAGYEESLKGKIGVAVEVLGADRTRYIVIFNPNNESTGAGSELGSGMSVRWIDDSTIEYDVLVKKNGQEVKSTEKVKIFF